MNLDKAYIEIALKTKIEVMKLAYIPKNLEYVKADIGETRAVIYFKYGEYKVNWYKKQEMLEIQ